MANRRMRLQDRPATFAEYVDQQEQAKEHRDGLMARLQEQIKSKAKLEDVAVGLSDADLVTLVCEWATVLELLNRVPTWKADLAKALLKEHAKQTGWREREIKIGDTEFEIKIRPSSKSDVNTVDVIKLLLETFSEESKEKKEAIVAEVTSVNLTTAKKYIGPELLTARAGMTTTQIPVGSISLKPKA